MEIVYQLNEVEQVAKKLIKNVTTKTILFYGEMGVGKTTLIKEIATLLGCQDQVSSPTFSIVNEYNLKQGKLYHFDFYRIKDTAEVYDFGIEDYLDSNHWKLIEWPEKVDTSLFDETNVVTIILSKDNKRILKLNT